MTATISTSPNQAPLEAFTFSASEACKFADPTERKDGLRRMPVNVLARTGRPVYHWYWEWIVHDMDGMKSKPTVAFDYRHDANEPIGFGTPEVKDGSLYLDGELLSRKDDDEAAKIMDLGPAGVPYENSIHFDPRSVVLEFIPEGAVSTVNGQEVTGPVTIMRQWELLRCAFCLTGVDGGSQTFFDAADETAAMFQLNWKDGMTKTATKAPAATTAKPGSESKETGAGKQSAETSAPETKTGTETTKPESQTEFEAGFRQDLKRYTDRFGAEDGAKYFSDGVAYTDALEQHCAKLEQTAKSAVTNQSDAEAKLAKLDLGENEGVDTGTGKEAGKNNAFESCFSPAAGTAKK